MKKIFFAAAIMFTASLGIVQAQSVTKRTTARQVTQQAKIAEGINSEKLTRAETARLEKEQKKIQLEKRIVKSDGTVTPKEKRFLRHEQNRANRHIKKQKNNKQERRL